MTLSVILIGLCSIIFIWAVCTEESAGHIIGDIGSFLFGCLFIVIAYAPFKSKQHKDYIYINRYNLGVQTVVKDSIEDTIFITDKYMTKDEFIKEYIEKR